MGQLGRLTEEERLVYILYNQELKPLSSIIKKKAGSFSPLAFNILRRLKEVP